MRHNSKVKGLIIGIGREGGTSSSLRIKNYVLLKNYNMDIKIIFKKIIINKFNFKI